eukprot:CAMPEP_0197448504 /NCGR_PEP_ID=MMETSP1175-20131217/17735_1 /TAXON_ID=1003142 /ORGANISM="Triceratium dubium, Strain CCMP147" /LENGTH=127 /DNA_ID=CAMNT_0042980279 /DNA_START=224 /DNA_END=607 /DNA_ORIENTATION=+
MFDASLTVGLPPVLTEDYVSRVTVDVDEMAVEARSIRSSAFEGLKSRWKLRPVPAVNFADGNSCERTVEENEARSTKWCDVEFEVEMSVSDPIIVTALDKVMEEVAGSQVSAFEKRCKEVHFTSHTQ